MKKVLSAILVLALALSCMAISVNAAELENLTKRATSWEATSGDAAKAGDLDAATAWVADTAQATITMGIDIPLPMGYIEINFGDVVANEFKIQVSSDATSWTDVVSETGNMKATYTYEWTSATQRYVKIEILATEDDKPATIAEIITRQNKNKEDTSSASAYPSSGVEIPDGSYLIHGDIIGLEAGWGDNPATGAAAAFDGDVNTFFDPLGTGNGWAGIDAGEEMTLTKVVIHPRADNLARYYGAQIDASNDPDFADYTTIFVSVDEAEAFDYIEIDADDFDDNGSFRYFRYFNTLSHGDVAEVELYGEPKDGSYAELSAYPSSGVKPAEGSTIIKGDIIGLEAGWGDNPATGAAAAFDGDINTFFDPLGTGNGYAGIDAGQEYTLTKVVIHPRADNLARYYGAQIDASNDPDFADYTTIFVSVDEAEAFDYIEIDADDFDDNGSFRYFRYFNTLSHGDVAEVELYGEPTGTAPVETEAPAADTPAPETLLSVEKTEFAYGEDIMVTAHSTGEKDWVGIYSAAGTLPGDGDVSAQWFYANISEGTPINLKDHSGPMAGQPLEAGDYILYFLYDDGYEIAHSIAITVKEAAEAETEAAETEAEVVETEAPETEAEVVEEADAPQTFDFGVVAAIAAVVSLAGYAVSKKH